MHTFKLNLLILCLTVYGIDRSNAQYHDIELDSSGKYQKYLVAIHPDVPEDRSLIEKIKRGFQDASVILKEATGNIGGHGKQFAFGTVHILIPKTWSSSSQTHSITWEKQEFQNLQVHHRADIEGRPNTIQPFGCESQGFMTMASAEHIKKSEDAIFAKEIVHEFAHLRWGVYDEYNLKGPHHYIRDNRIVPIRCTDQIVGKFVNISNGRPCYVNPQTNEIASDCHFIPNNAQTRSKGSLMYATYLDSVQKFCSSDSSDPDLHHSIYAPNVHNKICRGRSVQDVIAKHKDFVSGPRVDPNTQVNFRVVREANNRRVVLVFDKSSSMSSANRIGKVRIAAKHFIDQLEDGTECGLVKFDSSATRMMSLQKLTSSSIRDQFKRSIDTLTAGGGTCIGCGMRVAMEVLGVDLNSPSDGISGYMELMSDGAGSYNGEDRILYQTSIVFDAISISQAADAKMEAIRKTTGGKHILILDSDSSTTIQVKLDELLKNRAFQNTEKESKAKRGGEELRLVGNINHGTISELSSDTEIKVTAYFTKKLKFFMATQVSVLATVYSDEGTSGKFYLRDNGNGADVEANDGIYTAYILNSMVKKPLKYAVKLETLNMYPHNLEAHTDMFEVRTAVVQNLKQAPARITSLRTANINVKDRKVTLKWIAVGSELDQGQAYKYVIKAARNPQALLGMSSTQVTEVIDVFNVQEAGMEMTEVISSEFLNQFNGKTIYFTVQAVSGTTGLLSEPSNIVSASLGEVILSGDVIHEEQRGPDAIIISFISAIAVMVSLASGFAIYKLKTKKNTGKARKERKKKGRKIQVYTIA